MSRNSPHIIETKSWNWLRTKVDSLGKALFREFTGRDYGMDAIVELFSEDGMPTGRIAFLQIKATEHAPVPLKRAPKISCGISTSCASYALQDNIPMFLTYISLKGDGCCYYLNLCDLAKDIDRAKLNAHKSSKVRIPQEQYFTDTAEPLYEAINAFFDRV